MSYKKREIDLEPEVDLEFRRIEGVGEGEKVKIVKILGSESTSGVGNYLKYEKIATGGETETVISGGYKENTVEFYLNGQLMRNNYFYTEYNPTAGIIRHDALVEGDWVLIKYLRR